MSDYAAERASHAEPVNLVITTKVPSKWRFVDLETGDIWRADAGRMVRADDQVLVPSDSLVGKAIAKTVNDLRTHVAQLQGRLLRVRAVVRLLGDDELTPTAQRRLNSVLGDDYEYDT
jgi:hypothetical protein